MKQELNHWIEENWGKRCKDYESECPCCKAWDCFDYLVEHVEG